MHPLAIIVLFFAVLAVLMAGTALLKKPMARIISAIAAFGWACLMFAAASWANSLNYNAWYSEAASNMLKAYIDAIEGGRTEVVVSEMKQMANDLTVTYENRGNFRELAERAAKNVTLGTNDTSSGVGPIR